MFVMVAISSIVGNGSEHVKIRETTTVVEKDSFEELKLKTLKDVEQLSER